MQEPLFEEPTLTVAELNAGIGGAVRRAFPTDVWVRGEISDLSRPPSGHVYFDLRGDGCSIPVTLWAGDRAVVNAVLRRAGGAVRFNDGTEVRIRAQVTWWDERGRLALRMMSIDTEFTLGRLAEARELLVARLRSDGTLDRQKQHIMPIVAQRIGLVTSVGSAAEADFMHSLEASGLSFAVALADARVQGVEAQPSVIAALTALAHHEPALDVICIVRGGGARTDLAAFDLERVVRTIADSPLPVLTGIGHEIDVSVADLVAHRSYKTPTACAGALVERAQSFCSRLDEAAVGVARLATGGVQRSGARLRQASTRAATATRERIRAEAASLDSHSARLRLRPARNLDLRAERLDQAAARLRALDPARVLARGWSITRDGDGRLVRSASQSPPGSPLVTTLADGTIRSTIDHVA